MLVVSDDARRALRGEIPPLAVAPSLEVGAPVRLNPGDCRNVCGLRSPAGTARASWEPPSRAGWHGGRKVLWCGCCERLLREVDTDVVVDEDGSAAQLRPIGLSADVDADVTRWRCDACGYDTVWLRDVRGAGERGRG